MRYYVALSLLSVALMPQLAAAECPTCNQPAPCATGQVAPALQAGCCPARNHSNDNAWDGFCQEQACFRAIWARVGTGTLLSGGKSCGCKTCGCEGQHLLALPALASHRDCGCSSTAKAAPVAPLAPCSE